MPALASGRIRLSAWVVAATLGALLLVSLWLRTRGFDFYYWVDEGLSVGIASHPLAHIPSVLRQDGSPPLYYLLLHIWMSVAGRSETATHTLSLIFALLTIPVAYWAGSSLWDRRAGLVCAGLAAGSPYLTAYAQETRMYALMALLSLVLATSFLEVYVRRRRRYLPLFSVSLAASLYTHNWAIFLAAMTLVAFGLCLREAPAAERRPLRRDGAIGFGVAGLLFLPWVPTLIYQARHTGAPWDLPPVVWSLTQGLYSLVGGRGAAVALLLAAGTGLLSLRPTASWRTRLPLAVECLLVLGLGTLALAWVYSKLSPAWAFRYLAVIVGPLLLVAGVGLARARRLGVVALVLLAAFWLLDPVPHNPSSKSNVAAVAAQARHHLGVDPLVLATQPEQVATIAYYLPSVTRFGTPLGRTPDPRVMDWRNALAKLRRSTVRGVLAPMLAKVAPGQRVLLIVPANIAKQPLWMKLIRLDSERWRSALNRDPSFRRLAVLQRGLYNAGVAVQGYLYERRS